MEIDKFNPGASILKGMSLPKNHRCTRIIIRKDSKPNTEGRLEVTVRLSCEEGK